MGPILIASAVSTAVYATTRTVSHMCTQPTPGESFYNTRILGAKLHRETQDLFKDKWDYLSNVVWDNLWISAFALTLLLVCTTPVASLGVIIGNSIVILIGTCTLIWISRLALSRIFPSTAFLIAPKS